MPATPPNSSTTAAMWICSRRMRAINWSSGRVSGTANVSRAMSRSDSGGSSAMKRSLMWTRPTS